MPFINLFFRENESNKIRRAFLVVLMAIVLIPSTLELAGGGTGLFGILLKVSDKLYPALYYSVGVYYFYNKKKLLENYSSKFLLWTLIGVLAISSIVSYKRYIGGVYLWENWNSYNGIFVFLCATILFLLLMKVNLSKMKASMAGKIIELFSQTSFYIYLLSYIFDNIYYSLFADIPILNRMKYPVIPLLVFLSAFILGMLVDKIYKKISEKIDFVVDKIQVKANIKQ